jgi:hypothetical protein
MIPRINKTIALAVISLTLSVISQEAVFAATVPAVTILAPLSQGLRAPTATVLDADGNAYVADPRSGGVVKFNKYGKPIKTISVVGTPQGVAIASNGNLLVSSGDNVTIFDANGTEIGKLGKGAGQFKESGGITVDANGYIYVVDSGDNCVQAFNAAGVPVTIPTAKAGKPANSFGTAGTLTGQFSYPTAIAYEKVSNLLVVADTVNGRVQAFKTDGTFVRSIGSTPGSGPLKFVNPRGIAFDYTATTPATLNRMYVVDSFQGSLQAIDPKFTTPTIAAVYLSTIGSNGTATGQLMVPSEATFDPQNRRLMVVNGFGNVTIYGIDGGTSPSDNTPPTLSIDPIAANVAIPNITISGSVEASATVMVTTSTAAVAGEVVYTSATTWKCDVAGLVPGNNTITVSAKDSAWNVTTQSVSVNYLEPAPALTLAASVPGLTNNANLLLTGSVDAGAVVTVKSLANGATGAATVNGNEWSYAVTLTEGVNSFTITAAKPASATATINSSITLDSMPPKLVVSALANGSYTNVQTQNISGTVSDPNLSAVTLNGKVLTIAANGSYTDTLVLLPGQNTIIVSAFDTLGNAVSDSRSINFDASLPIITVSNPADNSYTNKDKVVISGTLDKDAIVKVAGVPAVKNPANNLLWTAEVLLTAGINTISIEATDLYGNTNSAKRTITMDIAAPELAIKDPVQDISTNSPNVSISGTITDSSGLTLVYTVNDLVKPVTVANGAFSFNVDFAQEGAYPVILTATDAAGNVTTATRNLIYDITPPALTLDPSASAYPSKLTGTVEVAASVAVKEGDKIIGTTTVNGQAWSAELPATYDPAVVTVVATDAAGNSSVKSLIFQFADGDIDGDGKVTITDALRAIRMVTKDITPTAQELAHGDIGPLLNGKPNPNGKIDLVDAILILRKAVGLVSW